MRLNKIYNSDTSRQTLLGRFLLLEDLEKQHTGNKNTSEDFEEE